MSTLAYSDPVRRGRRFGWGRRLLMALTAAIVLVLVGSGSGRPAPPSEPEDTILVSYAAAAGWLGGMSPAEVQEQVVDWARIGLASHLELDTSLLRGFVYDSLPVRDAAFVDLARQPVGPGRALFDGVNVLHLLVPRHDRHEDRTIGLALDQFRTDAGTDPPRVQVHYYQVRPEHQLIELSVGQPRPTDEVRSAHGYLTMRVDAAPGLTQFLAETRHLSGLEVRGTEILASGWRWPNVPAVPLDHEDVSVIQRGYVAHRAAQQQPPAAEAAAEDPDSALPGFSLDPGPPETQVDVVAALPDVDPELVSRLFRDDWAGSPWRSVDDLAAMVEDALFDDKTAGLAERGLPTDRTQLWGLLGLIEGQPVYSQATYYGGLAGTEVGMTLFYTDYVAKDWVNGVGDGVPATAVDGFIPDPEADIPWSHCAGPGEPLRETGRLWFGPSESGFSFAANEVSIGAQATRLFARSDAVAGVIGGAEVEPSFGFGRGLRWWDQHYQAIADYEPQYQRLDQIIRWSGALEWLVATTPVLLPQLPDADITTSLRFARWYTDGADQLREHALISFVRPPSADQEAVLTKPSKVFEQCGYSRLRGGVSLSDLVERRAGHSYRADVPMPVRRAGPFNESSIVDPTTGSGKVIQVSLDAAGKVVDWIKRTLTTTSAGRFDIDIEATGRRVVPFGGLKIWRAETATRELGVELAADKGSISQSVDVQGHELGTLVTHKHADLVTVAWRRGPVERMRRGLESLLIRPRGPPGPGAPKPPVAWDEVLLAYQDSHGRTIYKIGGPDAPWLLVTSDPGRPGTDLALRLGHPDAKTGVTFRFGRLVPRPTLPTGDGPELWLEITPADIAGGDYLASAMVVPPPDRSATRVIRVELADGRKADLYQRDTHLFVPAADPVLGLHAPAEASALQRDFRRVDDAMHAAAAAKDGFLRGVRLGGDGVALAGPDHVMIAPYDHQWTGKVLLAPAVEGQYPLVRLIDGEALLADPNPLAAVPGTKRQRMSLGEAISVSRAIDADIFADEQMRALLLGFGSPMITDAVRHDLRVTVRQAYVAANSLYALAGPFAQPDVHIYAGTQWFRATTPTYIHSGPVPGPATTEGTGAIPGSGSGGGSRPPGELAPGRVLLLVCPDTDEPGPGCAD